MARTAKFDDSHATARAVKSGVFDKQTPIGDVDYDEYDDDMSRRDFEDYFVQHELLLELAEAPRPDWLEAINDDKVSLSAWSLDTALNSALEEAWGRVE